MKCWSNLFGACLSGAFLTACGGGNVPSSSIPTTIGSVHTPTGGSRIIAVFDYSGGPQLFVVPRGMTELTIVTRGASGNGASGGSHASGLGGALKATIHVTPGETLRIYVGGEGTYYSGGYNGGGASYGSGGGGASDVRQGGASLRHRVLVSGGGGGQGIGGYGFGTGSGGAGGGKIGGNGDPGSRYLGAGEGYGGTQSSGGSGGNGSQYSGCDRNGGHGGLGKGGSGGGAECYAGGAGGSGGGGGYYGGGGGGQGSVRYYHTTEGGSEDGAGGGGGGSSYAEKGAIRVVDHQGVWGPGNGQVIIARPP